MERGCKRPECTVAQTGKCALNRDPNQCDERLPQTNALSANAVSIDAQTALLVRPPEKPKLPNSQTLDLNQMREIAATTQAKLIGVLGSPDSGKTAALVSTYLLLAHNKLSGFTYAYSKTLLAFDEISRGARRWKGGTKPEQMTVHTEVSADRGPGFMHLRLLDTKGQTSDLLIPDLPGEWTDSLVDNNRTDRWTFLKSADLLCIFVDGRQLATQRQYTAHRTKLLIQRLATLVSPSNPPVVIAVTHRDQLEPNTATVDQLVAEAARYGLSCNVISIASFTNNSSKTPAGFGIPALIGLWINPPSPPPQHFWPDVSSPSGDRMMLQYRNRE